jgi:hypothetical protein
MPDEQRLYRMKGHRAPMKFSWNAFLPAQLLDEARVPTLERLLVESFRAQIREQIKKAKSELPR